MIETYLNKHLKTISESFDFLDKEKLIYFANILNGCKGVIFFSGVGKNGHVASKAASTFSSMGIKSYFLNPIDAVHGDMGIISENDIIVVISKSGNTSELINFLENCFKKNKNIWMIHSNEKNQGLKYCEGNVYLPINNEADDLNIVPTVSIAAYVILLQSISCEISSFRGLTLSEFVSNHPGGTIGKLL